MFDLMQYALIFYDFQLILARMWVGPQLEMAKELSDHLALRDGGDDPQ
jgi:hypothetical protein